MFPRMLIPDNSYYVSYCHRDITHRNYDLGKNIAKPGNLPKNC